MAYGCCGSNKIDLKIPFPEEVDLELLEEYMNTPKKSQFDYFQELYSMNYVNNPQNQARAKINMEQLVGAHLNRPGMLTYKVKIDPNIEVEPLPQNQTTYPINKKGSVKK